MSLTTPGRSAVLLLAHGTADSIDDIPEFLLHVTGGRPVPPQVVEEVRHRYSLIGHSPMNEITAQQGKLLAKKLGLPVYVALRNWKPFIPDVVKTMAHDGVQKATAICLAPQNSRTSVGLYRKAVDGESGTPFALDFVDSWHDHPLLIKAFAEKLHTGWTSACREANATVPIIFTAHSVPQRTIAEGDRYETQAHETAALVAKACDRPATSWSFAFQSQGMSGGAWLGPTVEDTIKSRQAEGNTAVFIQPIGFLCDHVEVLYDIDIGFQEFARNQGMRLWRAESLNESPLLIGALADIVRSRASAS
ncbi:MAG: ferrochelatase [Acidobacteria bacterium]|nr:MAG: ferrochelatase [Acidobacteriota bacterium]